MSSHYKRRGTDIFTPVVCSKKGNSGGDDNRDLILLIGLKPFSIGPLFRLPSPHLHSTSPIRAPVKTTAFSQVSTNPLNEKEPWKDWLPARCRLQFLARFTNTCHANEGLSGPGGSDCA